MYIILSLLRIHLDAAPEVVGNVLARVLDNDSIVVDWSGTFQLNGLLQFYRLLRNSTRVFDGLETSTVLFNQPKGLGKTLCVEWGGLAWSWEACFFIPQP